MQGLDDEDCSIKKCFPCSFEKEVFFKMRGICLGSTKIDTDYLLKYDKPNFGNFYLRGFAGLTRIAYSPDLKGWLLTSYRLNGSNNLLGIFNDTTATFPIGLQSWYLYSDCEIIDDVPKVKILKLTQVTRLAEV
jgi:hypothetical protein